MTIAKREHKNERVKREKDPLDVLGDLERYAREGFGAISEDDLNVRLRWYGLYTQRPQEDGFFMLRVKVTNGTLDTRQLETLGRISQRYGRNTGDVTTRQAIQFHYIRIEDTPAIFRELAEVGITTSGACGDITRNVTGCPVAGIAADELIDGEPTAWAIHNYFLDNREFSNLPRKFKITVSGCASYCTCHEINDIGLVGVKRPDGDVAFDLWVGGGLGSKERFAERLGVHIRPDEAAEVSSHIAAIFRDYGNRESRHKARLKFILAEWGAEKFRTILEERLGRRLTDGDAPDVPVTADRAHVGIHPQKQPGLYYVGTATKRGVLNGDQMIAVARLAREYGDGTIRLTPTQNLIFLNVPQNNCLPLANELRELDLHVDASSFRTGTLACTGRQFCKLAVVETKSRAADIIEYLETALPDFTVPLRISVTGCPNSCAHYQVCDIGLVGDVLQSPEGKRDAFRVYLGGHLGNGHAFGRELDVKIPVEEAKHYVERVVRTYLDSRQGMDESFQNFIARHDLAALNTF